MSTSGKETVALIGTGIMGRGMAMNLARAGHPLRLYARNPDKIKEFAGPTTLILDDAKTAAAGADVTILCLTEDHVVRDYCFDRGVLSAAKNVVIDTGTTSLELTAEIAATCASHNVDFIDAPMTGSRKAAEDGKILYMTGGSDQAFEKARFLFTACGKNVVRCGPVGHGQKIKIALNMVQAGFAQMIIEALMLVKKSGADTNALKDVLLQSAVKSDLAEIKLGQFSERRFAPNFSVKNMNKDLNHALAEAAHSHAALPLASSLKLVYDSGMAMGLADLDFSALLQVNELLNGLAVEGKHAPD
ncbi:MAG: NAD(P)-dependent oxidoreductase [Spirochaetia bacterium]|nr:NAD(P)-dependent oxidoreductase [Spirochaetia bacterium]